jgi:excisionase family DNA binding protein
MDNVIPAAPEVMTVEEAAEFLRLSKDTVYALAREGRIPGRRVGTSWRFLKKGIEDWLRGRPQVERDTPTRPIPLRPRPGRVPNDLTLEDIYEEVLQP